MKKIGITGGIGSGKSIVADVLQNAGYCVYIADIRAKYLMNNNEQLQKELIALLGSQAYVGNQLNKLYVGNKIFADSVVREKLNSIVHPAVKNDFQEWCSFQKVPFVFYESALLFETGAFNNFDFVVLVLADDAQKLKRVISRDGLSAEQVKEKMASQMSDAEKLKKADFMIDNSGNTLVIPQICELINKINGM